MQSPYVPETPGRSPVMPEEVPVTPAPEVPADTPPGEPPQPPPRHPDQPEALAIRVP